MWNKEALAPGDGGALCSFPRPYTPPRDGTHSSGWIVLLSSGTGTAGSLRIPQTKGRTWGEGRVVWIKEPLAAGAGGMLHSLPVDRCTLTPLVG